MDPSASRDVSKPVIMFLLLFAAVMIPLATPVSANPVETQILTFGDGSASVDLDLIANITDTSTSLALPRNVTVSGASMELAYSGSDTSPGQVAFSLDGDSTPEFAWTDVGLGDLGDQTTFSTGLASSSSNATPVWSPAGRLLMPSDATVDTGSLRVELHADLPSRFHAFGAIEDLEIGDLDGDGRDEVVLLTSNQSLANSARAVGVLDWNGTELNVTWTPTCSNGTTLGVGHISNGTTMDIVVHAPAASRSCHHQLQHGTLVHATFVDLSMGMQQAHLIDMDGDGFEDLVSRHQGGILSMRRWNATLGSHESNVTAQVNVNGTFDPAILAHSLSGRFLDALDQSLLIVDVTGEASVWNYTNGMLSGPFNTLSGLMTIETPPFAIDVNTSGLDELIVPSLSGTLTYATNGTTWSEATSPKSLMGNMTTCDLDADGVVELVEIESGSSDGNPATTEGRLNAHRAGNASIDVERHATRVGLSAPMDLRCGDLDGDGVAEHIVVGGEASLGLAVLTWHSVALDYDFDGLPDLEAEGYAGDGLSHPTLGVTDIAGNISTKVNQLLGTVPGVGNAWGVSIVGIDLQAKATGAAQVRVKDLELRYGVVLTIDAHPSASNLSSILNQQMTIGTGTLTLPMSWTSTRSGSFTLQNLLISHFPGAPQVDLPPVPNLTLIQTSPEVIIAWQNRSDFGNDLVDFRIVRMNGTDAFDPTSFATSMETEHMDSNIAFGMTYRYYVQSVHQFGVTSNWSEPLNVTIPYPPPPTAVTGLQVSDRPNDAGGALDLTWDAPSQAPSTYALHAISSTTAPALEAFGPDSLAVSLPGTSTGHVLLASETSASHPMVDGVSMWVAVLALDQWGRHTSTFAVVEGVPLNNTELATTIDLTVLGDGSEANGMPWLVKEGAFSVSAHLLRNGVPITNASLEATFTYRQGTHVLSGTTDAEGIWQVVNLTNASSLIEDLEDQLGELIIRVTYSGSNLASGQTLMPSTDARTAIVVIPATLTGPDRVEFDADSSSPSILDAVLTAAAGAQPQITGTEVGWTLGNESGTTTVAADGGVRIVVSAPVNGTVSWSLSPTSSIRLVGTPYAPMFVEIDGSVGPVDNGSENGSTNGTAVDLLPLTSTCDSLEIPLDAATNGSMTFEVECRLVNPNEVALTGEVTTPQPILVGASITITTTPTSFTVQAQGEVNLTARFVVASVIADLPVGDRSTTFTGTITDGPRSTTFDVTLGWSLSASTEDTTSTGGGVDLGPETTSSGNNGLIAIAGIGGLLVLSIIVGAVIVLRGDEDDEFDFEDEDDIVLERDVNTTPLPASFSLSEARDLARSGSLEREDTGAGDRALPSLFGEEEIVEVEASEAEDDGITVDEDGTEWYEDETGTWWYRESGMEDWAEYEA